MLVQAGVRPRYRFLSVAWVARGAFLWAAVGLGVVSLRVWTGAKASVPGCPTSRGVHRLGRHPLCPPRSFVRRWVLFPRRCLVAAVLLLCCCAAAMKAGHWSRHGSPDGETLLLNGAAPVCGLSQALSPLQIRLLDATAALSWRVRIKK